MLFQNPGRLGCCYFSPDFSFSFSPAYFILNLISFSSEMGRWDNRWAHRRRYSNRRYKDYDYEEPPPPPPSPHHPQSNPPLYQDGSGLPWEIDFCKSVHIPWHKVLTAKKFMYCHESVLAWDDSAGEEAFQNAKQRYWEKINGLPSETPLPDPDMYLDKLDWNAKIDSKLVADIDGIYFNPDEMGHSRKFVPNQDPDNGGQSDNLGQNYEPVIIMPTVDNPWEPNSPALVEAAKYDTWTWHKDHDPNDNRQWTAGGGQQWKQDGVASGWKLDGSARGGWNQEGLASGWKQDGPARGRWKHDASPRGGWNHGSSSRGGTTRGGWKQEGPVIGGWKHEGLTRGGSDRRVSVQDGSTSGWKQDGLTRGSKQDATSRGWKTRNTSGYYQQNSENKVHTWHNNFVSNTRAPGNKVGDGKQLTNNFKGYNESERADQSGYRKREGSFPNSQRYKTSRLQVDDNGAAYQWQEKPPHSSDRFNV